MVFRQWDCYSGMFDGGCGGRGGGGLCAIGCGGAECLNCVCVASWRNKRKRGGTRSPSRKPEEKKERRKEAKHPY